MILDAQHAGLSAEVAVGFNLLSFRHHQDGNYAAAHEDTLRAAEAGRQQDPATVAKSLGNTGRCLALIEREVPRAESMLNEAQALAARSGVELIDIPWGLGLIRAFAGEYDEAARLLESAVRLAQHCSHWAECEGLQRLALIELERGNAKCRRARSADRNSGGQDGRGSEAPFAAMLMRWRSGPWRFERRGSDRWLSGSPRYRRQGCWRVRSPLQPQPIWAAICNGRQLEPSTSCRGSHGRRSGSSWRVILARVAHRRGDQTTADRYAQAPRSILAIYAVAAHARRAAAAINVPTASKGPLPGSTLPPSDRYYDGCVEWPRCNRRTAIKSEEGAMKAFTSL